MGTDAVSNVAGVASRTQVGSTSDSLSAATGSGLYNYNITYVNGSETVTTAPLTITGATKTVVYNGTTQTNTFTTSGLLGTDTVTALTGSAASTNVGTFTDAITGSTGSGLSNYSISYVNGSETITKAPLTLTASGVTKVYNGSTSLSNVALTPTGVFGSDNVSAIATTGTFASANVGSNIQFTLSGLALSGSASGNYTLSTSSLTGKGSITPASLVVSGITASDKVYDGNTSATVSTSGLSLSGLVSGDNVTVTSTGLFASKNAGVQLVSLTNVFGGSSLSNYSITDQSTTSATISPAQLYITGLTAYNKVYDGSTAASLNLSGLQYIGLIGGDRVYLTASGFFINSLVGVNKLVLLRLLGLGADAGNYNITFQQSTTASILPVATPLNNTSNASLASVSEFNSNAQNWISLPTASAATSTSSSSSKGLAVAVPSELFKLASADQCSSEGGGNSCECSGTSAAGVAVCLIPGE